jgi:hypothetical protein
MKRNPYAVQSVDSGWVHGVINHHGGGAYNSACVCVYMCVCNSSNGVEKCW